MEFSGIPKENFRSSMALGDVTHHNMKQLRKINQVVFPVSYNDKFYKDVLEAGELAKLVYFNDIVVGGVCCRIDTSANGKRRMYIMTLGCLAPYRRIGLGKLMLDHVFSLCEKDPTIESIFLHVQISNDSAIEFYRKFNFEIVETTENYYKRIEPTDAFVLEKSLKKTKNDNFLATSKNFSLPSAKSGPEIGAGGGAAAATAENSIPSSTSENKNDSQSAQKKKIAVNLKKKQQEKEEKIESTATGPQTNGNVDETGSSSSAGGSDKENSDPKD